MDFNIKIPITTITSASQSKETTQAIGRPYCLLTNSVLSLAACPGEKITDREPHQCL